MTTLNYIPGSNFLGVVARQYKDFGKEAYDIFHAGKVRFGDGLPTKGAQISWRMPFSMMTVKNQSEDHIYLQHLITNADGQLKAHLRDKQLKQKRGKFLAADGTEIPDVKKGFRLKSAHDADMRRSRDEQMFGFEFISRGQNFLFSVDYDTDDLLKKVEPLLIGDQRIGKSRTAEYGWVDIKKLDLRFNEKMTFESEGHYLVYIESHLCHFDQHGMPSYEPDPEVFGIRGGKVDWGRSQLRNISWAPWNAKRNTTDTQRHAIAAGSVLCIVPDQGKQMNISSKTGSTGGFQAEGLGRYIINPFFLSGDIETAKATLIGLSPEQDQIEKQGTSNDFPPAPKNPSTLLGKYLQHRMTIEHDAQDLMKDVYAALQSDEAKKLMRSKITSSQWGTIRSIAEVSLNYIEMSNKLFGDPTAPKTKNDEKNGYLYHGVAYQNIWGADNDLLLRTFKRLIDDYMDKYKEQHKANPNKYGTAFVARFCF